MKRAFTLIELPVVRRRAFTLIELLVIIAIIGILSTIVTISVSGAKAKARDASRKTDLNAIKASLQVYYADQNPNAYVTADTAPIDISSVIFGGDGQTYMKTIPTDPDPSSGRSYKYQTDATPSQNFLISADLENDSDGQRNTQPPTGFSSLPTGHDFWLQND